MARMKIFSRAIWCRKKCGAVTGCLLLLYIVRVIWLQWTEETCSLNQSMENIKLLCQDYREGHLTGSLCPYVCDSADIMLQKCLNYAGGKEIYLTTWKEKNLIMKSKKPSWYDYQRFLPYGVDANQANLSLLLLFMSETINDAFDVKLDTEVELLHHFWFLPRSGIPKDVRERLAMIESVWSLFQQDEYVSIMFLRKSKFMPLIYGTCGHYYFMEYLPSGKILSPKLWPWGLFQSESVSWKSRVVLSLYLLELIRSLDSGFHDVIHMCDMKGDNFGLTVDGAVKIIDTDMLLSKSKLMKIYKGFHCVTDSDCDFFDCKARCDIERHSCVLERINSNLKVLCEQIFRSHLQNGFNGLLDKPPKAIFSDLNKLLDQCVTSNTANPILLETIYRFLNAHLYTHLLSQHSEQLK